MDRRLTDDRQSEVKRAKKKTGKQTNRNSIPSDVGYPFFYSLFSFVDDTIFITDYGEKPLLAVDFCTITQNVVSSLTLGWCPLDYD